MSRVVRVLLVEDDEDTAWVTTLLLERFGCEVRAVSDSLLALATASDFRPHVICLDLSLPGQDGYALSRQFRDDPALAGVTIFAISGYALDVDRARKAG